MTKHATIALDAEMQAFVESQIDQGRYRTTEEVIAAALRALEERQREERLYAALKAGEESGELVEFDPEEFLSRMHSVS